MIGFLKIAPTDANQLQDALDDVGKNKTYSVLELAPNNVCTIDEPVTMNDGTTIIGQRSSVLKLVDRAPTSTFGVGVPMIGQRGKTIQDITLHGFTIDGNVANNGHVKWGQQYHTGLYLRNAQDVSITGMYVHDSQGDAWRFRDSNQITVNGNKVHKIGHDGLHCRNCTDINASWNDIVQRTNSGLRVLNSSNVTLAYNRVTGWDNWASGGAGIQIDRVPDNAGSFECHDIRVYGNDFIRTWGAGVALSNFGQGSGDLNNARNVSITRNRFIECGQNPNYVDWVGGITWTGWDNVLVDQNVFYKCKRYAISAIVGNTIQGTKPDGSGYKMTVVNNTILDTQLGAFTNSKAFNGYAIANNLPDTHSIQCNGNYLLNSTRGGYKNCTVGSDYVVYDPIVDEVEQPVQETGDRLTVELVLTDSLVNKLKQIVN